MINLLIGLIAGLFGGLVGVGGGVIMIPLMVGVLRLTQHQAHGSSLVALVFTGLAGAITYAMKGSVDVVASALLAVTAIFTARFGAHFAHALPEWKLKRSFGGFLLFVSILLLLKPYLAQVANPVSAGWAKVVVLMIAGVFTGFLSGMMGVGGGTIMVPAMVLLAGMGQHMAQGSSLLAMVPAGAARRPRSLETRQCCNEDHVGPDSRHLHRHLFRGKLGANPLGSGPKDHLRGGNHLDRHTISEDACAKGGLFYARRIESIMDIAIDVTEAAFAAVLFATEI